MNQAQKRKKKSAALAVVLAAALALTGTFAWQSISQVARNEAKDTVNPGGRLHDDFSGYNVLGYNSINGKVKNICVENFTDPDDGGIPIYARIKLTEYMETGNGAGDMNADGTKATTNKSVPLVSGTSIDNPADWPAYYPDKADDAFRQYWNLSTGGSCWYMPTFNKNKDSLAADINGTMAGTGSGVPYDDYKSYWKNTTITADAYYDADANTDDEGATDPTKKGNGGTQDVNYTAVEESHTGVETPSAHTMTMDEWIAAGAKSGPYWVFDEEDGWAYWAQAIEPGTASGCVLNSVTRIKDLDDDWYYSINATGQFATAFDWGNSADGTGFYKDGETVSANGLLLLNTAAKAGYTIAKEEAGEYTRITYADRGQNIDLKLYIRNCNSVYDNVEWKVKPEEGKTLQAGTKVTGSTLTVDANEPYETKFTVEACIPGTETVIAKSDIIVETEGINKLRSIQANSLETANIDGNDWYVLANKSTAGKTDILLFSKEVVAERQFDAGNDCTWSTSDIRTYLNGAYIDNQPILKGLVKETTINTRNPFTAEGVNEFTETTDKVFLPSEADALGTLVGTDKTGATLDAKDFTYEGNTHAREGTPLIKRQLLAYETKPFMSNIFVWLRSPLSTYTNVPAQLHTNLTCSYYWQAGGKEGVRPAMWITLTN